MLSGALQVCVEELWLERLAVVAAERWECKWTGSLQEGACGANP